MQPRLGPPSAPGGRMSAVPTPSQMRKYARVFLRMHRDGAGCVSMPEALLLFRRSGLGDAQISHIWGLADARRIGRLGWTEFVAAMHLTGIARLRPPQQPLPPALPPALAQFLGGLRQQPQELAPRSPRRVSPRSASPRGGPSPMSSSFLSNTAPPGAVPTPKELRKYARLFQRSDTDGDALLSTEEACEVLERAGVPRDIVEQVVETVDIYSRRSLAFPEFAAGVHLTSLVRAGLRSPAPLPPELQAYMGSICVPAEELAREGRSRSASASRSRPSSPRLGDLGTATMLPLGGPAAEERHASWPSPGRSSRKGRSAKEEDRDDDAGALWPSSPLSSGRSSRKGRASRKKAGQKEEPEDQEEAQSGGHVDVTGDSATDGAGDAQETLLEGGGRRRRRSKSPSARGGRRDGARGGAEASSFSPTGRPLRRSESGDDPAGQKEEPEDQEEAQSGGHVDDTGDSATDGAGDAQETLLEGGGRRRRRSKSPSARGGRRDGARGGAEAFSFSPTGRPLRRSESGDDPVPHDADSWQQPSTRLGLPVEKHSAAGAWEDDGASQLQRTSRSRRATDWRFEARLREILGESGTAATDAGGGIGAGGLRTPRSAPLWGGLPFDTTRLPATAPEARESARAWPGQRPLHSPVMEHVLLGALPALPPVPAKPPPPPSAAASSAEGFLSSIAPNFRLERPPLQAEDTFATAPAAPARSHGDFHTKLLGSLGRALGGRGGESAGLLAPPAGMAAGSDRLSGGDPFRTQ